MYPEAGTWLIVTFRSMYDVLDAEAALLAADLAPELIPVPSAIHSNCGVCLRLAGSSRDPDLPKAESFWRNTRRLRADGTMESVYERIADPD